MKIELTEIQVNYLISVLKEKGSDTGRAFYYALAENLEKQYEECIKSGSAKKQIKQSQ